MSQVKHVVKVFLMHVSGLLFVSATANPQVEKAICSALTNYVNGPLVKTLDSFPLSVKINDHVMLNYRYEITS